MITQFANAATESGEKADILTSLGIDWTLLVLQLIAFLILVGLLAKFVYPVFLKIVDERQAKVDEGVKAAEAAKEKADEAHAKVEDTLKTARSEASDIVATAKLEATQMIEKAETDAKKRSDRIVAEAQESLEKDVIAARKTLHNETLQLVAQATEKVVGKTLTPKLDEAVIADAIKGSK
jgi:F-type H+-transporting ATPase subunit b